MMLFSLLVAVLCACIEEAEDGGASDGGGTSEDGGGAVDDGGKDGGFGDGGGSGDDGGAAGYGDCDRVTASLDGYGVELDPYAMLSRRHVEPASGEDCEPSVWVHASDSPQMSLAVYFAVADVEALDGAEAELDAAAELVHAESTWFHQIQIANAAYASKMAPLLVDHPEVNAVYVHGRVTWAALDSRTSRIEFTSLCWPVDPGDSDEIDCESFLDAWIELSCDDAVTEAGPVGVASWVMGPSGETLCIQAE